MDEQEQNVAPTEVQETPVEQNEVASDVPTSNPEMPEPQAAPEPVAETPEIPETPETEPVELEAGVNADTGTTRDYKIQ